jgi:hypothetical protein
VYERDLHDAADRLYRHLEQKQHLDYKNSEKKLAMSEACGIRRIDVSRYDRLIVGTKECAEVQQAADVEDISEKAMLPRGEHLHRRAFKESSRAHAPARMIR